jgi:NADH-quinone oxidoreductase subunit L
MLLLVLGNNFLVMFIGWEGVGLCSYLLIGYYYKEEFPPYAGRKAFIVNRIGDAGFLLALFALASTFGSLRYTEIFTRAAEDPALLESPFVMGLTLASFVALFLFVGAMGKSAQIPLYVWLPDAMAGPTPVSALIHAATMVTAGVYMVARANVVYQLASGVSAVVATVGCLTAIFAATIALAQTDIKKVLAYSTVSQLGYMFLGAGVGAFVAAIFHLVTHAFFKACLFLGAGSVIHANHHTNDMRLYGGLRKWMPWTFGTYLVATLAIAGFPLLSGFFSKDEILVSSLTSSRGHVALWVVGSLAAVLTSFYMFRSVWMTFLGENRAPEEVRQHIHESPRSMTGVLAVLAAGAIVVGFLGVPAGMSGLLGLGDVNWFEHRVHPVVAAQGVVAASDHGSHGEVSGHEETAGHGAIDGHGEVARASASAGHGEPAEVLHGATAPWTGLEEGYAHPSHGQEWGLVLLAVVLFGAGLLVAWLFYGRGGELPSRVARAAGPVYRLVYRKYWVDELYDRLLIRPYYGLCRFFAGTDRWVVDGTVNATAVTTELTGQIVKLFQTGLVRNYALLFLLGVVLVFWLLMP